MLNTGNGFDKGKFWINSFGAEWKTRPSHKSGEHTMLMDMNGDGLPDKVFDRSPYTETRGLYVMLNTGNGFDKGKFWINSFGAEWKTRPSHKSGQHTMLIDMNGDGLPDKIFDRNPNNESRGFYVMLNTGNGFDKGKFWINSFGAEWKTRPVHEGGEHTMLMDINGDGLPDKLFDRNPNNEARGFYVMLNTGNGFDKGKFWINSFGAEWKTRPTHKSGEHTMLVDINGDGLPDKVFDRNPYNERRGFYVMLNSGNSFNKLTSITDSFGNKTNITYKPLSDKNVYKKTESSAYPNLVVQSPMRVVSKVEIPGITAATYSYENLKVNYKGLGSLGFKKITVKNSSDKSSSVAIYRQDYPYTGLVKESYGYINDKPFSKSVNSYSSKKSNGVIEIFKDKELSYSYDEKGLLKTVTVENEDFDGYGNIGTITTTTADKVSGEEFIQTTQNSYENNEDDWILARLTKAVVTYEGYGDSKTKTSGFTYDKDTGILRTETIEPDSTKWLKKTYSYDKYGNKNQETISGAGIKTRDTKYTYDDQGKFIIKVTNPLKHSEKRKYNADGQITSLTGPNELTTTWEYDNFGKKIKETRADGTTSKYLYAFVPNDKYKAYKITIQSSGSPDVTTYYNSLGQKVRTEKTGFKGEKIYEDFYYDKRGEIVKQTTPYFNGSTPEYIYTYYDSYNRVYKIDSPSASNKRALKTIKYDKLSTVITNAKGQKKTTAKNAMGKIIKIEEEEGAYEEYEYYADGSLYKTTDPDGNTITLKYDIVGNKIYQDDPDMGIWEYEYNSLGQLTKQTDAKGQVTTITYDLLGRKKTETAGGKTSTWKYDTNFKGKLYKEYKDNFEKTYNYDKYGRPGSVTTRLDNEKEFINAYLYDSYGRVSTQILPNNFKVKNTYNSYGIPGIYKITQRADKGF